MAQLAQAYSAQNKGDRAAALYSQIDTLYPGSKYHVQAIAGKALLSLKQGKIADALTAVQPIIDQANKDIAPSPPTARSTPMHSWFTARCSRRKRSRSRRSRPISPSKPCTTKTRVWWPKPSS